MSIKSLNPIHHKIMRLYLQGLSQSVIAEQINMTPVGVNNVVNSPIFKHEFEKKKSKLDAAAINQTASIESEAISQIKLQTKSAVQRLIHGMRSDNESIAIKSAESILDRAGVSKITKNETNITGDPLVSLNIENLALIKQTLEMDQ